MENRTTLRIVFALYVLLAALHILAHAGDLYFQDGRGYGVWQVCSASKTKIQCPSASLYPSRSRSFLRFMERTIQAMSTIGTVCFVLAVLATLAIAHHFQSKRHYAIGGFLLGSGLFIVVPGFTIPAAFPSSRNEGASFGAAYYVMWIAGAVTCFATYIIYHLRRASPEQAAPNPALYFAPHHSLEAVDAPPSAAAYPGAQSAGNVAMAVLPTLND